MPSWTDMPFDALVLEDESAFQQIGIYTSLKQIVRDAGLRFRVLSGKQKGRWDRAVLLNLTFWSAAEGGSDVLVDNILPADVVAHIAWHHLAAKALFDGPPSADALFLGESIASAFDVYLVGRLLNSNVSSSFLDSQVPAMAEAAETAGLSAKKFERLLGDIAAHPERAFEELRQLLFDTTTALVTSPDAAHAAEVLERMDNHRFGPILHHYELSNWVLYARAYAATHLKPDPKVRVLDSKLRQATDSVAWLTESWVVPAKSTTRAKEPS